MKLRLNLTTKNQKDKDVDIKFNIAPSKHLGFINFINLALKQDTSIEISFEKISKTGERDESKIFGEFNFQGKKGIENILKDIESKILDRERHIKKQKQKKKIKK